MAIKENVKDGVYRVWNTATSAWDRYALWTKANRVEFNDGDTIEGRLGNIKGITTSTNVSETGFAADATVVAGLSRKVSNINIYVGDDGMVHFVDSAGADSVIPFKRRPWETFASLGGIDVYSYDSYNHFVADTDAVAQALSVNSAVDYLTSNQDLYTMFLDVIAAEMTESPYCLSKIKADPSLIALLLSNSTALENIKTNSSAIKTAGKSLTLEENSSNQSTNASFTVNGLIIYCDISCGGQFWGYDWDGKGKGTAATSLTINGSTYLSCSAGKSPNSGENYTSYSSSNRKYNTTISVLSSTCKVTLSSSPSNGGCNASGGATVYYL